MIPSRERVHLYPFFTLLLGVLSAEAHGDYLQIPDACLAKEERPCAISVKSDSSIELGQGVAKFWLLPQAGAKLLLDKEGKWNLVEGTLGISSPISMSLKHGIAVLDARGKSIVERKDRTLNISVIEGSMRLKSVGPKESEFTSGLSVSLGTYDPNEKRHQVTLPKPYDFQPVMSLWFKLYKVGPAQLKADMKLFHELWKSAVEAASNSYSEVAARKIAAEAAEAERLARSKAEREKENQRLRELFRQKTE